MESSGRFGKYEEVELTELEEYWLWGEIGREIKDESHVSSFATAHFI